jgi:hypothetical protein
VDDQPGLDVYGVNTEAIAAQFASDLERRPFEVSL